MTSGWLSTSRDSAAATSARCASTTVPGMASSKIGAGSTTNNNVAGCAL